MEVLGKVDLGLLNKFIMKNDSGDIVQFTYKNTTYLDILDIAERHYRIISNEENVNEILKWLCKAIINLKGTFWASTTCTLINICRTA